MAAKPDMVALARLVANANGWERAKAFKRYALGDADRDAIVGIARDVLDWFPDMAGACTLMSAVLAARLAPVLAAPPVVAAGTLHAAGTMIFGDGRPFDGATVFSTSDPSWNGHAWVMAGSLVIDISMFRTAYSRYSPPALAHHILDVFGTGRGAYLDQWQATRGLGLDYVPRYVLSDAQVAVLDASAQELVAHLRG